MENRTTVYQQDGSDDDETSKVPVDSEKLRVERQKALEAGRAINVIESNRRGKERSCLKPPKQSSGQQKESRPIHPVPIKPDTDEPVLDKHFYVTEKV